MERGLLTLLLIFIMCVPFTACEEDEDEDDYKDAIHFPDMPRPAAKPKFSSIDDPFPPIAVKYRSGGEDPDQKSEGIKDPSYGYVKKTSVIHPWGGKRRHKAFNRIFGPPTSGENNETEPPDIEDDGIIRTKCNSTNEDPSSKNILAYSMDEWGSTVNSSIYPKRNELTENVVVSQRCCFCTNKTCPSWLRHMEKESDKIVSYPKANYYIADDGVIFEGIPHDSYDRKLLGELGKKSIVVTFMGKFHRNPPSEKALKSFEIMLKIEMCLSKILSPDYKILPINLYYDHKNFMGQKLEEALKIFDRYQNETETPSEGNGNGTIVSREEWGSSIASNDSLQIKTGIKRVLVRETSDRCFTSTECTEAMKKEQNKTAEVVGDLPYNYYFADDGRVYEGRRNPYPLSTESEGYFIVVAFLGNFHLQPVSKIAMKAFEEFLSREVSSGRLESSYNIEYFPRKGTYEVGNGLVAKLKKMSGYRFLSISSKQATSKFKFDI